jgi:hypothetical protein
VEYLIGEHGAAVWKYSLNQISAFCFLKARREKRDMAKALSTVANGSRADSKTLKKLFKELEK